MAPEIDFRVDKQKPSLRLLWTTDPHLDAVDWGVRERFLERAKDFRADAVLIGGDICNGEESLKLLFFMAQKVPLPIYFVLGNHDFYFNSIPLIRRTASGIAKQADNLCYLSDSKGVLLSDDTALIGHDGWSDGLEGDFFSSTVDLNDYHLIKELSGISDVERFHRLNALGKEAAEKMGCALVESLKKRDTVVILTHPPPFRSACNYRGKSGDPNWIPHFVGKQTGQKILEIMQSHPQKKALVLCGHSHSRGDVDILPNLRVITGEAVLGFPVYQAIILVS